MSIMPMWANLPSSPFCLQQLYRYNWALGEGGWGGREEEEGGREGEGEGRGGGGREREGERLRQLCKGRKRGKEEPSTINSMDIVLCTHNIICLLASFSCQLNFLQFSMFCCSFSCLFLPEEYSENRKNETTSSIYLYIVGCSVLTRIRVPSS